MAQITVNNWETDKQWAERIVTAVNNHKALVEFVRDQTRDLSSGMSSCECELVTNMGGCRICRANALIADIDKEAS